jgi:hypothetical protein
LFAPGPPHFAGRAIFRGPPRIPEQGASIKSAVSYSSGLFIDPLLLLRRFMPLCIILCRFILHDADLMLVAPLLSVRRLSYLFCSALLLSSPFTALCRLTQILMIPSFLSKRDT